MGKACLFHNCLSDYYRPVIANGNAAKQFLSNSCLPIVWEIASSGFDGKRLNPPRNDENLLSTEIHGSCQIDLGAGLHAGQINPFFNRMRPTPCRSK